jgi:TadE-like protein
MLDFVLTFPFFVMILLIVIQFALMVNARIVVSWAAFAAARSAVVWTDEGLEEANRRAQQAAAVACTAISPSELTPPSVDLGTLLLVAHGNTIVPRRFLRAPRMHSYALSATKVEVKAGNEKGEIGPHDLVTVTVTYQFHLAVPYADGIFSRAFGGWHQGGPAMPIRDSYSLLNEGRVLTVGRKPPRPCPMSLSGILSLLRGLF